MPGTNLTRADTAARADVLAVASYAIDLDLTSVGPTFTSVSTVRFSCSAPGTETFIDLIAPSVTAITLNGTAVDPATHFTGARVRLPGLATENEVRIEAECAYMNTGEGLHRFVDPVDNETYLYTQFEVPDSRRVFAVFEQPDLKAEFTFTITGPSHWQVISCTPTPVPEPASADASVWRFPPTPRISSYVTALVAGPYDVVRDEVSTRAGVIPLGVFCRRSLTPYLDADEILTCTKAGFAFFEEMFDCPYPFAKYDQLFTPEYNMGAMENVGCVTVNEKYVFRGKVPDALVERRSLIVLHELAHMWFGNLVTMKWWDDLWLNESFAEWASTTCQTDATPWTSAWTTFCTHEKAWAYRQDQLSSTHPVVAPINDLHDVEVNFDGITYAKGASVLKQLVAYVGQDAFVAGLRTYFAKYAWGNTTFPDLLSELTLASGRDLSSWARMWLETSGVNTLRPVIESDDRGLIATAAIEQTCALGDDQLRPHRLRIGLFDLDEDHFVRSEKFEVDVDGALTQLPQLIGKARPALILANDDDLAYAKIRLDPISLGSALAHPRGFTDTLPHSLVLASVWDMTRDAEMAASDYVTYALSALAEEDDSALLRTLLAQLHTCVTFYLAQPRRPQVRQIVLARLRELAETAPPGSDAQLQLITGYASLLQAGDDTAYVSELLSGAVSLPGLGVDTDMRWTLLTALAAAGVAAQDAIDAEVARDNTATGRERAALALASRPTAAAKAAAWAEGVDNPDTPNSVILALATGFTRVGDPALLAPYVGKFHDAIMDVWDTRTHAIAGEINGFYPAPLADQPLLDATNGWLNSHPDAPPALRRVVSENRDAVARALRVQARDAAAL
ncbi:MAG: aminopeptidase N [Tetrasphaera sp.]